MDLSEAQGKRVLYHVGHGPQVVGADADEVRPREAAHVDDDDRPGDLSFVHIFKGAPGIC